jgi:hypothetical protein
MSLFASASPSGSGLSGSICGEDQQAWKMTSMQWGSSLFNTRFVRESEGEEGMAPRSGSGASGGAGACSGSVRDELSCGEGCEAVCAWVQIPSGKQSKQMPSARLNSIA